MRDLRRASALLLASASLLAACSEEELPAQGEQLELDYPLKDSSGLKERSRLVLRDAAEWQAAWQQIVEGSGRDAEAPAIDFTTSAVIVVSMGRAPSAGYSIDVTKVTLDGVSATITVLETSPGRSCSAAAVITAPIDVFVVPRFWGEATFVERKTTINC